MNSLFTAVLNMSITASYVALVVILIRLLLKKAPKIFSYSLWTALLFRLICPISFQSVLSLIPNKASNIVNNIVNSQNLSTGNNVGIAHNIASTATGSSITAASSVAGISLMRIVMEASGLIWLLGVAVLLSYYVISYLKLKHLLSTSTLINNNIFETDRIKTPFVFGLIKPKIYIPTGLVDKELDYILKHEQTHIKRRDYLIKNIAFIVLAIHWFNPLMWVCCFLMVKDMEMSCDESVIKKSLEDIRGSYSNSLFSLSVKQSGLSTSLTFGERNVKSRVKNVLGYKKPAFLVIAATIILVVAVTAGLMANPKVNAASQNTGIKTSSNISNNIKTTTPATSSIVTGTAQSPSAVTSSTVSGTTQNTSTATGSIVYNNTQYGFNFSLPETWKGYSIVSDKWEGVDSQSGSTVATGPIISIRHPLWTSAVPRQDIPIMVFTLEQWNSLQKGDFHIGAAPIGPSELGRNSKYVFALPARYNFSFLPGYQEIEQILNGKPLQPV